MLCRRFFILQTLKSDGSGSIWPPAKDRGRRRASRSVPRRGSRWRRRLARLWGVNKSTRCCERSGLPHISHVWLDDSLYCGPNNDGRASGLKTARIARTERNLRWRQASTVREVSEDLYCAKNLIWTFWHTLIYFIRCFVRKDCGCLRGVLEWNDRYTCWFWILALAGTKARFVLRVHLRCVYGTLCEFHRE